MITQKDCETASEVHVKDQDLETQMDERMVNSRYEISKISQIFKDFKNLNQ